jgi:hypothetical protein
MPVGRRLPVNRRLSFLACSATAIFWCPNVQAQPEEYLNLGTIESPTSMVVPVTLRHAAEVMWFRVVFPQVTSGDGFIDAWTLRDYFAEDQMSDPTIIVFNSAGDFILGSRCFFFEEAVVSCGLTDPRPPVEVPPPQIEPWCTNPPRAGQEGSLSPGLHWLALGNSLTLRAEPWGVASPSNSQGRLVTFHVNVNPAGVPYCDPDFNWDGNIDQEDAWYLINVIAGGENTTGRWADYNRDGNEDQDDVLALIHTIAGGGCP